MLQQSRTLLAVEIQLARACWEFPVNKEDILVIDLVLQGYLEVNAQNSTHKQLIY